MANVSDKLASMACPLGVLYVILAFAAAQTPSPPQQVTPATVLVNKGVVVSLFPYPFPGHVELFEGIDPKDMTGATPSTQHPFLQENILITQLVPDPSSNAMYYIDVHTNSIYRWDNVTTTLNDQTVSTINQTTKVFEGLSRAICKLDLDYLTQNIYWSDPLLHWIAMKPANSLDPADTKILITDDVEYVAALALDAESKFLFWVSSAYEDGKMERSNLYGGERRVILSTSFGFVDDMTLDMNEKQLYWVDSYRMTVETATYDGTGRRVIRRLVGTEFTSIAVIEGNICLINYDSYEMQCMFKTSGDRYAYHSFYPSNPYAVGFFNPAVQKTPLENPCATKTCNHICVNTALQPKCLCGDGYTLDPDGMTCSQTTPLYENAVVMTNSTHICMIQVSSLSSSATYKPIRCEVTNVTKDTTHIQSHVAKNLLYYTAKSKDPASSNKTQLVQFDLSSQRHWVVVADMEEPDDMAFDWVGEKMFTCHSKLKLIKAWDVVTGRSSIIYSGNDVKKVSELAIDPHRANLFWIADTIDGLGIYVGTFTGDRPVKLIGSGTLTNPSGISYEYLDDSVCFIDSGRFASITVNGTITNHRISVGSATKSLIYKNYAVWNAGPATLKMSLFSLDASVFTTITTMGTIHSIALFSKETQKAYLDPCKISNGGCDDLCFRRNTTVYCQCDFGRTLKPDGKACSATPLTTNFMLVADLSHDRIIQVSLDGNTLVSLPINNLMTPAMVRYGHHDDLLYWCEVGSKDIKRGTLDGTRVERLITIGGESYPDRFAIDFTSRHLYYTVAHTKDINKAYIAVMIPNVSKSETKTLITGLNYVGGIVLHPAKGGMLYWTADYTEC
ncbi:low-density lipoprotein receptor-related protein 6-like [Mizuhopecten yessoensis]|uniref:low-density lipoprotein receptor-related protein 6-like n=1 Tax=Mizuhopecten yessoensis TaxID=6573 RepID=UPI000B459BD1|nr:low-density lipoprotein receptor-related protein 6-like [Mizuhopecten yessoensis]